MLPTWEVKGDTLWSDDPHLVHWFCQTPCYSPWGCSSAQSPGDHSPHPWAALCWPLWIWSQAWEAPGEAALTRALLGRAEALETGSLQPGNSGCLLKVENCKNRWDAMLRPCGLSLTVWVSLVGILCTVLPDPLTSVLLALVAHVHRVVEALIEAGVVTSPASLPRLSFSASGLWSQ